MEGAAGLYLISRGLIMLWVVAMRTRTYGMGKLVLSIAK